MSTCCLWQQRYISTRLLICQALFYNFFCFLLDRAATLGRPSVLFDMDLMIAIWTYKLPVKGEEQPGAKLPIAEGAFHQDIPQPKRKQERGKENQINGCLVGSVEVVAKILQGDPSDHDQQNDAVEYDPFPAANHK